MRDSWLPVPDGSPFPVTNLPYGVVVEMMDTLNRLGVESLGMVTEVHGEKGPK